MQSKQAFIPQVDIQCGCEEADLCLAMQMWGLKLQARMQSRKEFAAKLVTPREMFASKHLQMLKLRPIFPCVFIVFAGL